MSKPDYQQRVDAEKARHDAAKEVLDDERLKLSKYMEHNPHFKTLDHDEQLRMRLQLRLQGDLSEAIAKLSGVLGERIEHFG